MSSRSQYVTARVQSTLHVQNNYPRGEQPWQTKRPAEYGARRILDKALRGIPPTKREAQQLMRCRNIEDIFSLLTAASKVKAIHFGNQVFLYGFLYFSTHCRRMCSFCFYRKANTKCPRYRKDPEEVAEMAQALENSGVRLVDLTMGENVMIHDGKRYDLLVKLVRAVCDRVDIAIMISPGVLPRKMLKSLKDVGADSYALYQETHNKALFSTLRLDQGYDERMKAKIEARKEGLLIEEGILLGVGETNEDRMDSIFAMSRLGVSQVRAMGFLLFIFLIANTAPVTNLIKADMIKENTLISAPAIPLGLTRAALRRAGRNLVHDPLQLGVATMGVEACAN